MNAPHPLEYPARLENLEIKLMHLESALGQLSDAYSHQQRDLLQMRERLRMLTDRLADFEIPGGASATAQEPPPHY